MKKYEVLPVKLVGNSAERETEKKPLVIKSFEDTYVINGDMASGPNNLVDSNFGSSPVLHFKANDKSGCLYRRVLLKFDIFALAKDQFVRAELKLCLSGNGRLYSRVYS